MSFLQTLSVVAFVGHAAFAPHPGQGGRSEASCVQGSSAGSALGTCVRRKLRKTRSGALPSRTMSYEGHGHELDWSVT